VNAILDRWLVVIDMQGLFAVPSSEWASPQFASIVPKVASLVAAFGPRVVFTRFVVPSNPTGAWADYYARWPFARTSAAGAALLGIVPVLPTDSHAVIDRPTFGKWGPDLRTATHEASGLVLAGVSTDCCVLSTALAAADAGIAVEVVADACAGATDNDHQRALDAMALYAPLITITDVETASR
jgi:nicotinamidase-related amidase